MSVVFIWLYIRFITSEDSRGIFLFLVGYFIASVWDDVIADSYLIWLWQSQIYPEAFQELTTDKVKDLKCT